MSSFALLQVLSHLLLPIYPIPLSQRKEKRTKERYQACQTPTKLPVFVLSKNHTCCFLKLNCLVSGQRRPKEYKEYFPPVVTLS